MTHFFAGNDAYPRRLLFVRWGLLVFSVLFIIAGCSGNAFEGLADDDSDDAKLEEARIALDNAEYNSAARMLNELLDGDPSDPKALAYLSHAYAGLAGLDTLDLLTIIDELDESGDSGSIDMIGLVLGDSNGDLTGAEVATKIQYINDAIDSIELIEASGTLSDDETVQRGVLAVARTAMVMADIVIFNKGLGSEGSIRLTEAGISSLYTQASDLDGDVSDTQLDQLSEDIVRVQDAILVLIEMNSDNDLSEDFDEFEQDLNPDGNAFITIDEVEGYIDSLTGA